MIYVTCHIGVETGTHDRAAEPGLFVCSQCLQRTSDILSEIGELYEWISDPSYLAGTREPPSHYTKSRPPVSLHAVSLLDQRTKYRRKGDPVSPRRVLRAWAEALVDVRSPGNRWVGPVRPVWMFVSFLQSQLAWIMAQPAGTRFARHMAAVLHSLRQEVGAELKEEEE